MKKNNNYMNNYIEGLPLLFSLGKLIDDPGEDHNGDILINNLTHEKLTLVNAILDFMNANSITNPPYYLLYDSDFYTEHDVPNHYNLFNSYTIGMIIDSNKIEKNANQSVIS